MLRTYRTDHASHERPIILVGSSVISLRSKSIIRDVPCQVVVVTRMMVARRFEAGVSKLDHDLLSARRVR